jgi:hypothetical protein
MTLGNMRSNGVRRLADQARNSTLCGRNSIHVLRRLLKTLRILLAWRLLRSVRSHGGSHANPPRSFSSRAQFNQQATTGPGRSCRSIRSTGSGRSAIRETGVRLCAWHSAAGAGLIGIDHHLNPAEPVAFQRSLSDAPHAQNIAAWAQPRARSCLSRASAADQR